MKQFDINKVDDYGSFLIAGPRGGNKRNITPHLVGKLCDKGNADLIIISQMNDYRLYNYKSFPLAYICYTKYAKGRDEYNSFNIGAIITIMRIIRLNMRLDKKTIILSLFASIDKDTTDFFADIFKNQKEYNVVLIMVADYVHNKNIADHKFEISMFPKRSCNFFNKNLYSAIADIIDQDLFNKIMNVTEEDNNAQEILVVDRTIESNTDDDKLFIHKVAFNLY